MVLVTIIMATRRRKNKAKLHLEQEMEVEHYSEPMEYYSEPVQHNHADEIEAYVSFSDTLSMSTLDNNMESIPACKDPSYIGV